MNEQNLKPPFTPTEARENGRKGGKASAKAKKERAAARDVLETVLSMPITNEEILKDVKRNGIPLPGNANYMDYIVSSIVIRTAKRGQMADLERLIEILGETESPNAETFDKIREILDSVPSVIK